MDLSFTPEQEAFRSEVRAFIQEAMPPHIRAKAEVDGHFEQSEVMEWHKVLYRRGWVAPNWPKEYGGPGLDAASRFILAEELELAGAPTLSPFGLAMVGPLIIQFGSEEQKARFLPKILTGEEVWCQGYSEPNAGSDLAAVRCEAIDDGTGHFLVSGQKTWTTHAQHADWIFCLVRTDTKAKKQAGISFLLVDMKTPGVEAKPMLTIGHTPAFSETFFENARVPKENVVGPLNGGWTMAKALLGHERTLIAQVGVSRRGLRRVKRIAESIETPKGLLIDDPAFRSKIARLEIDLRALQVTNLRTLSRAQLGKAPGPESSILKVRGAEILQKVYELAMEVMGIESLAWFNEPGIVSPLEQWVASSYCYLRATTIYGGTNEIQKNIIAKLILGLPS
ncbi:MAG: acyl-CoA dehydrogenase family protein [Deltaproteobacteria bacterium]|nr:acyl-CoA dehydrogenase family protein [Deltaproteobacteria bacterium]